MAVTLSIEADTLSEEALHDLTRELCKTLNREADVRAALAEAPARSGAKGDGLLLNTILMEILAHGVGHVAGSMVLMVLVPFFQRVPGLKAKLRGKSGTELVVDSESVRPDRLQQSTKDVNEKLSG